MINSYRQSIYILKWEPVLQDALVEAHLKLVLNYSSKVGYCEVYFCNVYIELHKIGTKVETILE